MLTHPTLEKLKTLRLTGMLKAFEEQLAMPEIDSFSFQDRLGLLLDREMTERDNRKYQTRLKTAKLRLKACLEDINYRQPRGLDKSLLLKLGSSDWIRKRHNLIITGPTGVGKTWIACALGHRACQENFSVFYMRLPRLLQELNIARGDGRYHKLLFQYGKIDLLILDDWGLAPFTGDSRRDLLEILDDRHELKSTLVTSQLPVDTWHEYLGDPTLADAILDRLIHNAYRINLKGESMRKNKDPLTSQIETE